MASIETVTGTAFVVAEFRAEENGEVDPLYQDPVVGLFLNDDTRQAAAQVAVSFPPVKDLVKIRTRYFDDMLDRQIAAGIRQVVVLGAGLDTRAARKPAAGVTYFEIDDAATLALKQRCYRRQAIDADVRFIPANYVADGLIDLLDDHGFDFDQPTYIIWEGNTMYLPMDCNTRVITDLTRHLREFRLSFDYMADAVVTKTTGDSGIARMVDSFAAMGAPWLSGIGDVNRLASELGLTVVDNFKTAELNERYRPGRPLPSPIFGFYSVCTLAFAAEG